MIEEPYISELISFPYKFVVTGGIEVINTMESTLFAGLFSPETACLGSVQEVRGTHLAELHRHEEVTQSASCSHMCDSTVISAFGYKRP